MTKINLLLLFGGQSSEHDISILSARNILVAIDKSKYTTRLCYITPEGEWRIVESIDEVDSGAEVSLVLGKGKLLTANDNIAIDVLFPVLHGPNGEDGTIQGLANLWHIPCVGPNQAGATITMNKLLTKQLLKAGGIPVVDWFTWRTDQVRPDYEHAKAMLGDGLFVKPAGTGSSVGVNRVMTAAEWLPALEQAARYDDLVLIEKAIDAREIELAVLGNESPIVSGAGEVIPGDDFYSYEDKYADSATSQVEIPARIDDAGLKQLQQYAQQAYEITCGHGMARIDFFIDKQSGDVFLNEINSIPGFTNISMYPKLWQQAGVSYSELIDRLIQLAIDDILIP